MRVAIIALVALACLSSACATSEGPSAERETQPQDEVAAPEPEGDPLVADTIAPLAVASSLRVPPESSPSSATTSTTTTSTTTTSTTTTSTTTTSTTTTSTTTTSTTTTSTTMAPFSTPYVIPVRIAASAGWGDTHSTYPATDIFAGGCGAELVSPVNGVLLEVRRVNRYDATVDNPATRGGRSMSVLGNDGVRYYLAHFETIVEPLDVGQRVSAGQLLGEMGTTGRSSACHVHFSISPPCPNLEWSVRRGVVWPYPYLNDWRDGGQLSPVDEVAQWSAENPNACAEASGDPFAPDA